MHEYNPPGCTPPTAATAPGPNFSQHSRHHYIGPGSLYPLERLHCALCALDPNSRQSAPLVG